MNTYQKQVEDFMKAMGQGAPPAPTLIGYPYSLRAKLLVEEALEFATAAGIRVSVGASGDWEVERTPSDSKNPLPAGIVALNPDVGEPNWAEMIDALCDILYVTFGAAVAMGTNLDPFFDLVHRANMLKSTGPVQADGKRLKPEGWQPPDIQGMLDEILALTKVGSDA